MPLYAASCPACGARTEYMASVADRALTPPCPACATPTTRAITMPAYTPSGWGDSRWSGRYDRGLGVVLRDKAHRERVMQARGLVEDTVYDQQNRLDKAMSAQSEHERTVKRYEANLREAGGDKGLAIANTFPSE